MPDVVLPCVLSKGGDGMPRSTSSDRLCVPKAMLECHARCRSSVCVLSQGVEGMSRSTSFDRVSRPRAVMACHA